MIPITALETLPKISGIYLVKTATCEVIYIGQATNIFHRWKSGHHKLSQIIAEYGVEVFIVCIETPIWLMNRAERAAVD